MAKEIGVFRVLQNVTWVKIITIVKPVSNTILLVIISAVKTEASAVLALGPTGLGANTANLESIPGPIQKQPVGYTILLEDGLGTDILGDSMGPLFLKPTKEFFFSVLGS